MNASTDRATELLARIEHNLNDLIQGLSLLGVKRCAACQKFFRSEPGALFPASGGEVICFECIPTWWPVRREQLVCEDRKKLEGNLVHWLRSYHEARSVKGSRESPNDRSVQFELTASCLECRGTGTYMGDKRCRYCDGPGAVRVIVPKPS